MGDPDSLPSYALITPARDEAANLARLARSIEQQTVLPAEWLVVENGSTDGTPDAVRALSARLPFVRLLQVPGSDDGLRGAASVRAFTAGLAALRTGADVVVNLDADVSMPPDYFEELLLEFRRDPSLGIASGACFEEDRGDWREVVISGDHIRGATRAYRRACLDDVLPLEERVGWDGIDVYKARARGWSTRTVRRVAFRHHRLLGQRDGGRIRAWSAQGRAAHYMGYRVLYIVLRTLRRIPEEPAAIGMLGGYMACALRRAQRIADREVREAVRRDQSLAVLPQRLLESLGRSR